MTFKCPSCNRPLYNRRRATCEFCGKPVPDALRLSGDRRAKIDRLKADEAKRHREFMGRDISTGGGMPDVPHMPPFGGF